MTRQIRDRLIYNENEYGLNVELLERYFREFPNKKPESELKETALWRGYIATFEIKDQQLYVREIEIFKNADLNAKVVKDLFPNNKKFDWFSGLIRIDDFR